MDYDYFKSLDDREFDIQVHEAVVASGVPNYKGCRIPLRTKLNISYLKEQLLEFRNAVVAELLEFDFPIEVNGKLPVSNPCRNDTGALDYSSSIDKYVEKELKYGSVMGPFKTPPSGHRQYILHLVLWIKKIHLKDV